MEPLQPPDREQPREDPRQRDESERALIAEYYQRVFGQDLPESVVDAA